MTPTPAQYAAARAKAIELKNLAAPTFTADPSTSRMRLPKRSCQPTHSLSWGKEMEKIDVLAVNKLIAASRRLLNALQCPSEDAGDYVGAAEDDLREALRGAEQTDPQARYRELRTVEDVAQAREEGLEIQSQWAGDSWIRDTTEAEWPGWADWFASGHRVRAKVSP